MFLILILSLLLVPAFMYQGNIPTVKASPDIHQGDLILTGNNITVIEGQFDINGSIIVEENATLILRNAVVNFTQKHWKQFNLTFRNSVNGNPRLQVSYATITSTPDFQFEIYFHGNSTAETYRLYVHNKVIAYETSYVNITDSLHIWFVDCRDSSTVNISNSEIWYVKPHDASVASIKDSDITMAMENYGTSTTLVSNSTIGFLGTYSSSVTAVSNCNITNMHPQGDHSSILTVSDSKINNFNVATSCLIAISHCTIISMETYGSSNVSLSNCLVNGMYMYSSSVVTVSNQLVTNGSIIVEENATLILKNALVNFTQTENWQFGMIFRDPAIGNPRLQVTNTIITSNYRFSIKLHQNSSAIVYDSQFTALSGYYCWLWTYDSSVASFYNLTVHGLSSTTSSGITVFNSTITTLNIYSPCTASIHSSTIYTANSYGPSIFLANKSTITNIQTFDYSLSQISDSVINWIYAYNETTIWLTNSTYSDKAIHNHSKVFVCWYLNVHVVDSINQDVPSANVSATYPNGTMVKSKLTDVNGWAKLTLTEKMMNATGSYLIGNYTVEATYEVYSDYSSVNMSENRQIELKMEDFIIPEFLSPLVLLMFMVTTWLAVAAYRKRSIKRQI